MYLEKVNFNGHSLKNKILNATSNHYKIYLITMDNSSDFSKSINAGVSAMSKLTGIPYIWNASEKRDVNAQMEILKNAINNDANAIMVAIIDPVKEAYLIEDAKSLGTNIIYIDTPANEKGIITLATDNYNAGITAGETMITELDNLGINNGSIGIVSVSLTTISTLERERGFQDAIKANGNFELLPTQYANQNIGLAEWYTQSFISSIPNLIGMFATNDNTTLGIAAGIEASPKTIVGIGFDLTPKIQEYINQGYLKAVMVQNPFTMGYLGMAETIASLEGYSTGPEFLNTGITVRNKYSY